MKKVNLKRGTDISEGRGKIDRESFPESCSESHRRTGNIFYLRFQNWDGSFVCFLSLHFLYKSVYCVHRPSVTPLYVECLGQGWGQCKITGFYCTDPQGERNSVKT